MSKSSRKVFPKASCGDKLYIFHWGSKREKTEENINKVCKETKAKNKRIMLYIRFKLHLKVVSTQESRAQRWKYMKGTE